MQNDLHIPHLHILLGQVYAETDRVPEAISECKQGLKGDENGSIHCQLARLYQKTGDTKTAETFRASQQLRKQWDDRASVVLQQSATDLKHQ